MKWHKTLIRTIAILAVVIAFGLAGGYLYLRSNGFRQFAIHKIVQQAEQATGGRVTIGGLDFQLSTLTAHLYNIVLHGNEPADAPPLLRVDKLTVSFKIQSVLHRKINLSELLIERPVAHLQVDHEGKSNIPSPPPRQSSGNTSIFDLAIGHFALSRGEVVYGDRKIPLDADLHDLGTDVTFGSLDKRYSGSISYDNGHVRYGEYVPLPHSLNATFSATPGELSLESATVKVGASSATLHARLANYSDPTLTGDGDYDLRLNTQDLAALSPQAKTSGEVVLSGTIHYRGDPNQTALRNVKLQGRIAGPQLTAVASARRIDLRNLQGTYELSGGTLRAQGIQAELLDGRIQANAEIRNLDTTPASRLQAAVHSISLQAAQRAFGTQELNRVTVTGMLDGTATASWTGSLSNMRGQADLNVRSAGTSSRAAVNVPVDGSIHATYDRPSDTLRLRQTTLRIPSATLTAAGQVSQNSSLQIHASTSDLHQLVALVAAFRPTSSALPAVSGSAALSATVRGTTRKPQIQGQLNAQDLHLQGSEWKTAQLSLQADPSRIVISNGTLVSAQRGEASFGANLALHNWSYLPSNPLQANLSVRQMSVADLLRLANVHYPVTGELSAKMSLSGSQLDPAGSGSLQVTNARAYSEPVQTLAAQFHAESGAIVSKIDVVTSAGSANAGLTFMPKTKAYKIRLDAPGIMLQKLRTLQESNLGIKGTVNLSASGEGTLNNPRLTATVQLPSLEVRQRSIAGLKADLQVAEHQANFTVDSQVAQASIRARGQVKLTGEYQTEASLDTAQIPLDALMAAAGKSMPEGFQGQTELHATIKGPLKNKSRLEAHLTVPTLNASYQSLQIGAAGPIRADYAHSLLTLQPAEIRGTGTSIRIQGNLPLAGTAAPTLSAEGTIDARILRVVSADLRTSGTVALDVRTSGPAGAPQIQGQVHLQNIALATAAAPLGVSKLNGTLDLNNGRVQITNMTAEVGGGQISAGGSVHFRPNLQFDIALQGKSVRLRYPEGLRSLLDANLTWVGTMQNSTLGGRVLINALSFTPDFDLASFGDQFSSNAATPAVPGFADTVGLRVAVQSAGNLSAASSQVSLEGSADLRIIGTAANPIITGRTNLNGGDLFYRNVRYQLKRGVITFADPNQTRPVLNVSIGTTVEQYNLTLNMRGPLDQLTTAYISDPPLATADIINLIARGKTSSELASSSQSTDSMLASQAASRVTSSVQKLAGISSLQIDPLLGGNNQNPSARLALQQRVSKNFFFTFSTDVTQPGQGIVQGDYQINRHWSVSVARDQLGGVSVDGRFHTRF